MPRKRSESAHNKVLDAALELIAEHGVEATSMDAVAKKSGVSKATIYKHWADKDALLLEVMAYMIGLHSRPVFDSGDTKADMIAVLAYRPPERTETKERLMPHFMAYSARNQRFGEQWRNMVMDPPRRELTHLMQLGIGKGELAPDIDVNQCLALLIGPLMYWHIFLRTTMQNPEPLARDVVTAFWKAFRR